MDFSAALLAVKEGKRVTRTVWLDGQTSWKGAYLELVQVHASDGRTVMPVLMVGYLNEPRVLRPFSGANWDLLAEDWEIAE
jgi:hypothetical protein